MNKPENILYAERLLIVKMILVIIVAAGGSILIAMDVKTNGILLGMQHTVYKHVGAIIDEYGKDYAIGFYAGGFFIQFFLAASSYVFLKNRNIIPTIICVVLLMMMILSKLSIPILTLVILVLVLSRSSREWFKQKGDPEHIIDKEILDR